MSKITGQRETVPPHIQPDIAVNQLRSRLLSWWMNHRRDFPWRHESDPYRILVAEVMLRRTQANQVSAVFLGFVTRFPSPEALGHASEDEIRELLRPLGLSWRAENVIALSRVFRQEGRHALAADRLRTLPGVGDYVAAAVRAFAYGEAVPVIDTNTARVACRVGGLVPTAEPRRDPRVRKLLDALLDTEKPKEFNLALIDLAAVVCRPTNPHCPACPIRVWCRHGLDACTQDIVRHGEG